MTLLLIRLKVLSRELCRKGIPSSGSSPCEGPGAGPHRRVEARVASYRLGEGERARRRGQGVQSLGALGRTSAFPEGGGSPAPVGALGGSRAPSGGHALEMQKTCGIQTPKSFKFFLPGPRGSHACTV